MVAVGICRAEQLLWFSFKRAMAMFPNDRLEFLPDRFYILGSTNTPCVSSLDALPSLIGLIGTDR